MIDLLSISECGGFTREGLWQSKSSKSIQQSPLTIFMVSIILNYFSNSVMQTCNPQVCVHWRKKVSHDQCSLLQWLTFSNGYTVKFSVFFAVSKCGTLHHIWWTGGVLGFYRHQVLRWIRRTNGQYSCIGQKTKLSSFAELKIFLEQLFVT